MQAGIGKCAGLLGAWRTGDDDKPAFSLIVPY